MMLFGQRAMVPRAQRSLEAAQATARNPAQKLGRYGRSYSGESERMRDVLARALPNLGRTRGGLWLCSRLSRVRSGRDR